MKKTDLLVKKALLGDKAAQEECTKQGIVLPCPLCGGEARKTIFDIGDDITVGASITCRNCHLELKDESGLLGTYDWLLYPDFPFTDEDYINSGLLGKWNNRIKIEA